jgi:hypothetical protein
MVDNEISGPLMPELAGCQLPAGQLVAAPEDMSGAEGLSAGSRRAVWRFGQRAVIGISDGSRLLVAGAGASSALSRVG